ncbi:UDP-3-O-(3-hydroxymyristoyl)glucosamine N-acyltransferase [Flavobacteriaceae bacterium]|nr:UDP-3-O-(3-hydroxymyristoyl)glucosamine N-acyltransferase [Flavobacteriaceae bacterium]
MNYTALEIAKKYNGVIEGNGNVNLTSLAKIQDAKRGCLSFLAHPKYISFLNSTKASAVLVNHDFKLEKSVKTTLIRVSDPYASFNSIITETSGHKEKKHIGIHQSAIIDSSVNLADDVYIGPYVTIGPNTIIASGVHVYSNSYIGSNVSIGKDTILQARVCLMDDVEIGARCILQSGSIIGCDGFGYIKEGEKNIKTPHLGKVVIEDEVEIGANSTVDRATLGETIIHKGVKLDNLVQIAHNVEIGPNTVIAAQSGIAGSTKIGSRCTIGGQVGIIGHLVLGDDIKIQGQSGVISDIPNGKTVQGTPAIDFKSFYKSYVLFKHFPDLENRLSKLEKI